jgi:hypothetical protein
MELWKWILDIEANQEIKPRLNPNLFEKEKLESLDFDPLIVKICKGVWKLGIKLGNWDQSFHNL